MPRTGDQIVLADGTTWTAAGLLGEGSQGTVHRLDASGHTAPSLALKWYLDHSATEHQRRSLLDLVERGSPNPHFLWPTEVVHAEGLPGFGYVMPVRPESYVGLSDLLLGRVDVPFSRVVRLCLELADAFLDLHTEGLCYRDISFGNVFFDPDSGLPLICDNDNVGIDGLGPSAVLGTRRFIAPEVVRGQAQPSSRTDLYALSVLVFYVLMVHHPLLGARELQYPCLDVQAEYQLFGVDPVFVFDPDDSSNAPVPGVHDTVLVNWALYPVSLRERFVAAFTDGLHDPDHGRVRESVWRSTLSRLLDCIQHCPSCGRENFAAAGSPSTCWACGRALGEPLRLQFDRSGQSLVLNADSTVLAHHLRGDYDRTPVGRVVTHPSVEGVWGLRNLGPGVWSAVTGDDAVHAVRPGGSVTLQRGLVLDLGGATCRLVDEPVTRSG